MGTTFWDQQEKARARTGRLWLGFLIAVTGMVLAIYLPLVLIVRGTEILSSDFSALWSGRVFLFSAVPLLVVIAIGTLFEMVRLSHGGAGLARQLRARQLAEPTRHEEQILLNVVEEMSIASGISAPPVYVFEKAADSVNALVAGNSTEDAAILITRGCLNHLNRDELQALVAHEFSHLFNGDMRHNLRAMSLTYGILCLAMLGLNLAFPDEGFGCIALALALPLVVVGGVGTLFAKILQKMISREREYLADASAVQFTRNPEALVSVMSKIMHGNSRVKIPAARAADHLFFASTRRPAWIPLFRTHPPLEERIRRIRALTVTASRPEPPPLS